MVVLDYFHRFGRTITAVSPNSTHGKTRTVSALVAKKSKTSWGAETVDYEKIAAAAVQAMTAADLHRFLVVCALCRTRISPDATRGSHSRQIPILHELQCGTNWMLQRQLHLSERTVETKERNQRSNPVEVK